MFEAFLLGLAAQSSLLIAGLVACWVSVSARVIGLLGGFGSGALIAAVSFDLIDEASDLGNVELAAWMLAGASIFIGGDLLVERRFGSEGQGGAMGIVVGSVVDGVPESIIFGIQVATGYPISPSFLGSVWVSNIPQSIAPSADLAKSGWAVRRVGTLWSGVVLACGVAAAIGFLAANAISTANGDRMAALAAGGVLAMLTTSLMPFSQERGGALAGAATVVGFCLSFAAT
jgi:zinc transporter, ZIP family